MPSARVVNHSGCSVTHGWSGEHCSARSSATSRPQLARPAPRRRRSRRACRGRGGWRRGRPPREPIAHGEPEVVGPGGQGVVRALAVGRADRVDRRQVDHVEAHRGDRGQPLRRGAEACRTAARRPASGAAPSERGKNSYQEPNSARSRSTRSGIRSLGLTRSRSGLRGRAPRPPSGVGAAASRAGDRARRRRAARSAASSRAAAPGRRPGTPRPPRSSSRAPSSQHQLDVEAGRRS